MLRGFDRGLEYVLVQINHEFSIHSLQIGSIVHGAIAASSSVGLTGLMMPLR
jgi:hypothetical protein